MRKRDPPETGHVFKANKKGISVCMWWHCGVLVDKKMELGDRALGLLLLLFSSTLFAYYTFWVIITPFVDTDHFVHNYFPAREYAIIIPGLAGAALISFVLVFVGVVMVKSRHAKPKAKTS